MTAKFARARARRCAVIARIITRSFSCHDAPSCTPQTRGLQDRRSVSENFEERRTRASLLHASLRSRWPCPFFISGRLCARACDGARFACYVPANILDI